MNKELIFFVSSEPNGVTDWIKVISSPNNSKEYYKYNKDTKDWDLYDTEQSSGITVTYEATSLKITKIVVTNGLITELEVK